MKFNDKKIWLIADLHFGHKNAIDYCKRPFKNVTEMNNVLIKKFNKKVGKNDIVFILGDLTWLNTVSTTQIVKSLHGFKYLIKGNHDKKGNQYYRNMGFVEVYDFPIIFGDVILSHEPVLNTKLINIYGHLHDKAENNSQDRFCVSVEKIDYEPIELIEILRHCGKQNGDNLNDNYYPI